MRILVVEDDAAIAAVLEDALREAGYAVDVQDDAAEALVHVEVETVDLALLDVRLPGMPGGGFELCARIREIRPELPILMVTALDSRAATVRGLDLGADDYVTKPFDLDELLARVRALLRRTPTGAPIQLAVGGLVLDPRRLRATRDGRAIELTAREFAVLDYLMRHPDGVVSSSELIDHAWDGAFEGWSNVVASTIRHLRRKLTAAGEPDPIATYRGSGYALRSDR